MVIHVDRGTLFKAMDALSEAISDYSEDLSALDETFGEIGAADTADMQTMSSAYEGDRDKLISLRQDMANYRAKIVTAQGKYHMAQVRSIVRSNKFRLI